MLPLQILEQDVVAGFFSLCVAVRFLLMLVDDWVTASEAVG